MDAMSLNLEFEDSRPGMGNTPVKVSFDRYAEGDAAAIILSCMDGSPYTKASVNLVPGTIEEGQVAIRNYNENEGILKLLVDNGIVRPARLHTVISGFVEIGIYQLTDAAKALVPPVRQKSPSIRP